MRFGLLLAPVILLALGCQKSEPTSWRSNFNAPIATASLNLNDFVADSLLYDMDGQLSLRISETLFDLAFDSLFTIPADTTTKTFGIPLLQLNIPPGVTLLTENEEYNFDQLEVQLKVAGIRSGQLKVRAQNSAQGAMLFVYRVPGAKRSGTSIEASLLVPGKVDGVAGSAELTLNLAGYEIDLRGPSGNAYNTLQTEFQLGTPMDGSGVLMTNTDEVILTAEYSDVLLSYAEGYFGSEQVALEDEGLKLSIPASLSEAVLNLPAARARIDLVNGFGADFRATITRFEAFNQSQNTSLELQAPSIGQAINLERALRLGNEIQPTLRSLHFDEQSSNLPAFISLIPDSLSVAAHLELNPLGNVSNFNDFMTSAGRLRANVELDIPLQFSVDGLLLRDTVPLNASGSTSPESGLLYIHVRNGFPLEAQLRIFTLSQDGSLRALNDYLLDEASLGDGYALVAGEGQISRLRYQFPVGVLSAILEEPELLLEVKLNSSGFPDLIEINGKEQIDIFVSTESQWYVEVR